MHFMTIAGRPYINFRTLTRAWWAHWWNQRYMRGEKNADTQFRLDFARNDAYGVMCAQAVAICRTYGKGEA